MKILMIEVNSKLRESGESVSSEAGYSFEEPPKYRRITAIF